MKHLKTFNESEDWEKYAIEGKMRKSLKSKLPLLGLKVRRKGKKNSKKEPLLLTHSTIKNSNTLSCLKKTIWNN